MGCCKPQTNKQMWARPNFCNTIHRSIYIWYQSGQAGICCSNKCLSNPSGLKQPSFISHSLQAHHGSAMPPLRGIFTLGPRHSAHASDLLPLRKKEMNIFCRKARRRCRVGRKQKNKDIGGRIKHRGPRGQRQAG